MGWQDRQYYRDRGNSSRNPLLWLLTGSVPLFTVFGIRVRAHASLILYILLITLLGFGQGYDVVDRLIFSGLLFGIILLHEFGHCFAARWVGGSAEDILMHPLGGLAFAQPPRRPMAQFITAAGGPMVNVVLCIICGSIYHAISGMVILNPFLIRHVMLLHAAPAVNFIFRYSSFIYFISWQLLIFNLLPIFPLDGGQILQTMLWPKFGYYKSMLFSATTGIVGAVVGGLWAIATFNIMLICVAFMGFNYCLQLRRQLLADGPYVQYDEPDYGLGNSGRTARRRRHISKWALRRARKRALADQAEQQHIDAILAKVSAHGMNSLNWFERRALRKATEHQRERDLEMSRERRSE